MAKKMCTGTILPNPYRNLLDDFRSKQLSKPKPEPSKDMWALPDDIIIKLDGYVGQQKVKNAIEIAIIAAYKNHRALDHMLFYGPPGFGKTKISDLICDILGVPVAHFTGKGISNRAEFQRTINFIRNGIPFSVLFIDEIHRISKAASEELFSIMQDFKYRGNSIPKFTLLGATTDAGLVTKPLRDRFKYQFKFYSYHYKDLALILKIKDSKLSDETIDFLVERCKGTPRILLSYYDQAKNVADYENKPRPTIMHCMYAMDLISVGSDGMTPQDIEYLVYLREIGKPVGKSTLAAALNISESDLTQIIEPWLLQNRLIARTPRGREITDRGRSILVEKDV